MTKETVIQPPTEAALMTARELAEFARLSVPKLKTMRKNGGGPRWVAIGRCIRYPVADARAWIASLGGAHVSG